MEGEVETVSSVFDLDSLLEGRLGRMDDRRR